MATSESFKDFVLENLKSALEDTPYHFSAKRCLANTAFI